MTINVMLDLETWGTRPGCDIRSIGACVFDPVTGLVEGANGPLPPGNENHGGIAGTFYIATDNPVTDRFRVAGCVGAIETLMYPLQRDPDTERWWSEQSVEAQAAFTDPVDLKVALIRLTQWIMDIAYPHERGLPVPENDDINPSPDLRIWSHGPQFDISILAAAYEAVGLPVPWHYRAPRDTRTAFDLAGIDDHSTWLKQYPGPLGIPHHSLDDSICQARAVCAAYGRLRISHDVVTHRSAWRSAIDDWSHHTRDDNGTGYWSRQLEVFDNTFDDLAVHPHTEK